MFNTYPHSGAKYPRTASLMLLQATFKNTDPAFSWICEINNNNGKITQ